MIANLLFMGTKVPHLFQEIYELWDPWWALRPPRFLSIFHWTVCVQDVYTKMCKDMPFFLARHIP